MTVRELIEELEKFSDDTIICIPGHSDGSGLQTLTEVTRTYTKHSSSEDWEGDRYETDGSCGEETVYLQ